MTIELSDARRTLADARVTYAATAKDEATLRAQKETLRIITCRPGEIRQQIAAAQASYDAAMSAWADAGAQGEPPSPPAALATLAKTLAQAEAQGAAAAAAAARLDGPIADAADASKAAHAVVGAAVQAMLATEVLPPLLEALHAVQLEAHARLDQLLALGWIGRDFAETIPALGNLAISVNAAAQVANSIELTAGAAAASREQWRTLIKDLFEGDVAQLPPAPAARFRVEPRKVA